MANLLTERPSLARSAAPYCLRTINKKEYTSISATNIRQTIEIFANPDSVYLVSLSGFILVKSNDTEVQLSDYPITGTLICDTGIMNLIYISRQNTEDRVIQHSYRFGVTLLHSFTDNHVIYMRTTNFGRTVLFLTDDFKLHKLKIKNHTELDFGYDKYKYEYSCLVSKAVGDTEK
jgi:hypothetical protein